MKQYFILCLCAVILLSTTGCNNRGTEERLTAEQQENTAGTIDTAESSQTAQESTAGTAEDNQTVTWEEITKDGVDEQELLNNINTDVLEEIAALFQALDQEIMEKESVSPEYVLRGGWAKDVIESEQYNTVISMGNEAMKPLYWIIYKSDNQGRYEYICALALDELSGFDFDEDGDGIKWASSKELLEEFNQRVIDA